MECGKKVTPNEKHTYKDCLKYKKEFKIDMNRRPGKTYLVNKMTQKEFNLSEEEVEGMGDYFTEDIKEAVKKLKSYITFIPLLRKIDKIFGEKLSK